MAASTPRRWFDVDAISPANADAVLQETMPAFVMALGIRVKELADNTAVLLMPCGDASSREGGIFSGQAISALADTAMCVAIWMDGKGRRPVATIDLHVTFIRGISNEALVAHATVLRSGRTMAFVRVDLLGETSGALAAAAAGTFSLPS